MSNRQYDNFDRFRDKPVRRRPNQGSRRRNKINNSNYNKFRDENGVRQRLWDKYNELISRIEAIRDREEKNSNKKENQAMFGGEYKATEGIVDLTKSERHNNEMGLKINMGTSEVHDL